MIHPGRTVRRFATVAMVPACLALATASRGDEKAGDAPPPRERWSSFLPFKSELATSRGIELPPPFGIGLVFYHLDRDIEITDVRVGRNGAPPSSVSDFAALSATSNVENLNLKLDAWILPMVNVYEIVGYGDNESDTRLDVTLPPLIPANPPRQFSLDVPTSIEGSVA